MARPGQWDPLGQVLELPGAGLGGLHGPQRSRKGWTSRLGPWAELVIENRCETPGWTGAGDHGIWTGLSQQRPLQGKERGCPVEVSLLRSS